MNEIKKVILEETLLVLLERDMAKERAEFQRILTDRLLLLKAKDPDQYEETFNKVMAKWDERNSTGAPEAGASADTDEKTSKPEKETPLSVFKKQKDNPALKNDKGTTEMPLQSYMIKSLGLPQQAVQKITKALEKGLKAKGLNIAESVFIKTFNILQEQPSKAQRAKAAKKREKNLKRKQARGEDPEARKAGSATRRFQGSTQEGDLIGSLTKTLGVLKTKEDVIAFKKALKFGKAPKGADELYRKGVFKQQLKDGGSWVKKAQNWFLLGKGKEVVKQKMDELPLAKAEEKFDKKELIKGLKGKKYGIIGTIMYNYALKSGAEDMEFIDKFSKLNPKEQQKILINVNKILKRQLKRRGWADNEIAQKLNEMFHKQ
tara:strand:+ start:2564 stop:3691 length:1128 start_codon:yes stop_codon:yes gene_type:complete